MTTKKDQGKKTSNYGLLEYSLLVIMTITIIFTVVLLVIDSNIVPTVINWFKDMWQGGAFNPHWLFA